MVDEMLNSAALNDTKKQPYTAPTSMSRKSNPPEDRQQLGFQHSAHPSRGAGPDSSSSSAGTTMSTCSNTKPSHRILP